MQFCVWTILSRFSIWFGCEQEGALGWSGSIGAFVCQRFVQIKAVSAAAFAHRLYSFTQLEPHYSRSARQTFELVCARRTFLLIYLSLCVICPCDKRVSVASSAGESKLCITWMRWCAAVKIQPVFICVWVGLVTRDLARMTCRHTFSRSLAIYRAGCCMTPISAGNCGI